MKLNHLQQVFQALSDKTRLRILCLLSQGELCVCDVMCVLKEPQSKISRHFAYLKRARLVTCRKQGMWMYYQLSEMGRELFTLLVQGVCGKKGRILEFDRDAAELNRKKPKLVACCR